MDFIEWLTSQLVQMLMRTGGKTAGVTSLRAGAFGSRGYTTNCTGTLYISGRDTASGSARRGGGGSRTTTATRSPAGEKRGSDSSRAFIVWSAVNLRQRQRSEGDQRQHPAYHKTSHETSMKQDASFFEGKDAVLIYIAKKLNEALSLETALTEEGIDYGVEADEYRAGVIFGSARCGG